MKDKKSLISKILIGGGLLALICGIFCFFGTANVWSLNVEEQGMAISIYMSFSNLFAFMFGTTATLNASMTMSEIDPEVVSTSNRVNMVGGMTALFVIEMIIIVLAVILLVGVFTKKLQKKCITIGGCVVCVLAIAAVVLTFCSKKMITNGALESFDFGELGKPTIEQLEQLGFKFSLGSAQISYGVLGIVGIIATGAGLFLSKDEK